MAKIKEHRQLIVFYVVLYSFLIFISGYYINYTKTVQNRNTETIEKTDIDCVKEICISHLTADECFTFETSYYVEYKIFKPSFIGDGNTFILNKTRVCE